MDREILLLKSTATVIGGGAQKCRLQGSKTQIEIRLRLSISRYSESDQGKKKTDQYIPSKSVGYSILG